MLRVHSIVRRSAVNGAGQRFVIWVQGCTLGCRGCFNSEACSPQGGYDASVDDVVRDILGADGIEGVTLSGGEPFQQPRPLAELCRRVKEAGLSVFVFSGYTLGEIQASSDPAAHCLLGLIDILLAGRFVETRACRSLWRGSENQTVHFLTDRYRAQDFDLDSGAAEVEVILGRSGEVVITGFPGADLPDALGQG